jgi:hypothetical protein
MKRGLFIGINYNAFPNAHLNGCINDAINMRAALESKYGYSPENSVSLHDDMADAETQPTRANILGHLRAIAAASANCVEVWIHYSGHGGQARDATGKEEDGLNETVLPCDYPSAGIITDDEVFGIIKTIKCRAVIIFDSCHSGSMCDLEWQYDYTSGNLFRRTRPNPANKIANTGIVMMSGCKDAQTSADTINVTQTQFVGAFSEAITDVLNRNCTVALPVLYKSVCELVLSRGFSQRPVLSCSAMTPTYVFSPTAPAGVATMSNKGVVTVTAAPSPSKIAAALPPALKIPVTPVSNKDDKPKPPKPEDAPKPPKPEDAPKPPKPEDAPKPPKPEDAPKPPKPEDAPKPPKPEDAPKPPKPEDAPKPPKPEDAPKPPKPEDHGSPPPPPPVVIPEPVPVVEPTAEPEFWAVAGQFLM